MPKHDFFFMMPKEMRNILTVNALGQTVCTIIGKFENTGHVFFAT